MRLSLVSSRRRSRLRPGLEKAVRMALAAACIWLALGALARHTITLRLRTAPARLGAVEELWTGQGLVVRREGVIYAPADGRLRLLTKEGEKVRPGDIICEINADGEVGAVPEALEALDRELRDVEEELRGASSDEERRSVALRAGVRRQELIKRREALLTGSRRRVHLVRAASGGLVSFRLDGLEDAVAPDTPLHDVTVPRWQGWEATRVDGESVRAGERLARLVDDFEWFLFASASGERCLAVGEVVEVRLAGATSLMRVQRAEEREGKILALLAGDALRPEYLHIRSLAVTLSKQRREGVLIPKSSLVRDTPAEDNSVYIMVEGKPVLRRLRVIARQGNVVMVENIPVGARVVTNPRLLAGQRG